MFKSILKVEDKVKKKSELIRFRELDSLRGIAALFVMIFHLSGTAGLHNNTLLSAGVTGVDLFFIISGYVIFMSLEKTKKPRDFIISRISRLYPAYIVMMGVTLLITFIFNRESIPSFRIIFFNSTMLQPWFLVPYIDDSYWTLFVELLFYASILTLFVFRKLDRIVSVGAIALVVVSVYYVVSSYYFPDSKWYIVPRNMFPLISHFQLFFAGILFYKLKFSGEAWIRHVLIAGCFLLTLLVFGKAGRAHFFIDISTYAVAVLFYLIVFYLFIYDKLKFLNTPVLVFLGSISYEIYLLHQQAAIIIYPHLVKNYGINPVVALLIIFVVIVLVASFVTFKVERPVIKLIRKRYIGTA